ncbi:MAG: lipopolysaccharide biosynthesis protein [Flammeovirgaceae bacterium]
MIKSSAFGKILFNAFGKLLTALVTFFSLKIIGKELGMADYGLWTQLLFAVKILMPLVLMQLETVLVRFYQSNTHNAKQQWAGLFISILGFNLLISSPLLVFPHESANYIFGAAGYTHFLPFICLLILTESVLLFLISFFRAKAETYQFTSIRILQSSLQLITLVSLLYYRQESLEIIISVFIGINIVICLPLFGWIAIKYSLIQSLKQLNRYSLLFFMRYGLPLTISGFSTWLIYASDRFFIAYFHDLALVGLYAAMSIYGSLAFMLLDAFNLLVLPQCVSLWEQGKAPHALNYAKKMSNNYLILAGLGLVLVILIGPQLLMHLSSEAFKSDAFWLALLTFSYLLPGFDQRHITPLYLMGSTHKFAFVSVSVAMLNLVLNFLLIPNLGIQGAILSTLISYLLRSLWLWWMHKYNVRFRFK